MPRSQRFRKDVKNQGHQGLEWLPNIYSGEGNGLRENKPIIQVANNPPLPLPQFFDGMTKRLPKETKTKNLTFVIQNKWIPRLINCGALVRSQVHASVSLSLKLGF